MDDFQYAPFQGNGLRTELQNHAAVNIAPKGTKRKREDEIVFNPALRGINRKKTMVSVKSKSLTNNICSNDLVFVRPR